MKSTFLLNCLLFGLLASGAWGQTTLTLEQCQGLAIQNNVTYRNSLLEQRAARQTRKAALTKYFPSISAGGAIFRSRDYLIDQAIPGGDLPVYDGNPAHLSDATQYAYFPGMDFAMLHNGTFGVVSAVQPVFAGGRIVNGNRLAVLGSNVADEKVKLAVNEVRLKTEEKYWQIIELDEKLITIRSYQTFLDSLTEQVNDAYQAGLILNNDLLKVKTKQSEIQVNRSKLENGLALAQMSFCQFIGISYDSTLLLIKESTPPVLPQSLLIDHGEALRTRAEYRLLQQSVKAAKLQTAMTVGEYLPQAGVGVAGIYTQFDKADGIGNSMVFGTVSIPLSGWWEAGHKIKEHKMREKAAGNLAQDSEELLLLQMDKAWRDLTDAQLELSLSHEMQQQAAENLRVAKDSYLYGLVTLTDLLDAEATLQQAMDQVAEANANYRMKQSIYLQVTGR